MNKKYTDILGVRISSLNYTEVLRRADKTIKNKKKIYICVAAVHLLAECQRNKVLLNGVNKADLVTPDGMPLVWLSRLSGKNYVTRVYGPKLTLQLAELSQKRKYKLFFLGGAEGESKILSQRLYHVYPRLQIVGALDTPVRPLAKKENDRVIKQINNSHADIVFIGLGCPYQEMWMINHRHELAASVLIGVGAAFDFISGRVKQAPTWMQKIGLEWFYRLWQDPKRLWYRYTITNISFLILLIKGYIIEHVLHK